MAVEIRCDRSGRRIAGHDAGTTPTLIRTADGYLLRVEVLEGPRGAEVNLHPEQLRPMLAAGQITAEGQEELEPAARPVPLRQRRTG